MRPLYDHKRTRAKLNEEQVTKIKTAHYYWVKDVASHYNVGPETINLIITGKTWRHIIVSKNERLKK